MTEHINKMSNEELQNRINRWKEDEEMFGLLEDEEIILKELQAELFNRKSNLK